MMVQKDKLFCISSILDESIKTQTPVYDVHLFSSFVDFERYIEGTPIIINTLVFSTTELAFTNTNMIRLVNVLGSPFIRITGSIIYIIDEKADKEDVESFFSNTNMDNVVIYQGEINLRYVTDIITGEARASVEHQTYETTYRVRTDEYIKRKNSLSYESLDDHYVSDDEDLEGVPDEDVPEEIATSIDRDTTSIYISGLNSNERTLFCFLTAQYLSLTGKTIIIEHDSEYHRLTEMYSKSKLDALFITVDEIYQNFASVLARIQETPNKLVVIGAVNRVKYSYEYLSILLYSNLRTVVDYFVIECNLNEVPYGVYTIYVTPNTVPEVLEVVSGITQAVEENNAIFIGLQMNNINQLDLSSVEYKAVIQRILLKNEISTQVLFANGLVLNEEGNTYDIFRIISRATS